MEEHGNKPMFFNDDKFGAGIDPKKRLFFRKLETRFCCFKYRFSKVRDEKGGQGQDK